MKRTRIGIRKKQRRANIILAILFLLILPIVAVKIGSKLTEWVVIPTINPNNILRSPENTNTDKDKGNEMEDDVDEEGEDPACEGEDIKKESIKETVSLNPISLYMVQVASVTSDKNIRLLTEELDKHKFPHTVCKLDDLYKVYTYTSTNREDIEEKLEKVRKTYEDAYIGQLDIPQKQVHYFSEENKGTKEIIEDINLLLKLLEQSSNNIYRFNDGEEILKEYRNTLEKEQKLLKQISERVSNTDLPKEFATRDNIKKMVEFQEKNIIESLKIIEDKEDTYKLQNYFLDNLFSIMDAIGK